MWLRVIRDVLHNCKQMFFTGYCWQIKGWTDKTKWSGSHCHSWFQLMAHPRSYTLKLCWLQGLFMIWLISFHIFNQTEHTSLQIHFTVHSGALQQVLQLLQGPSERSDTITVPALLSSVHCDCESSKKSLKWTCLFIFCTALCLC